MKKLLPFSLALMALSSSAFAEDPSPFENAFPKNESAQESALEGTLGLMEAAGGSMLGAAALNPQLSFPQRQLDIEIAHEVRVEFEKTNKDYYELLEARETAELEVETLREKIKVASTDTQRAILKAQLKEAIRHAIAAEKAALPAAAAFRQAIVDFKKAPHLNSDGSLSPMGERISDVNANKIFRRALIGFSVVTAADGALRIVMALQNRDSGVSPFYGFGSAIYTGLTSHPQKRNSSAADAESPDQISGPQSLSGQ